MAATKIRWGDTLDEDDSLPANSISGPDSRGVKTFVEYKRNDKGEAVKVTTKTRVSKVEKKVYKVRADLPLLPRRAGECKVDPGGRTAQLRACGLPGRITVPLYVACSLQSPRWAARRQRCTSLLCCTVKSAHQEYHSTLARQRDILPPCQAPMCPAE